ncbi:MAG: DUF3549 family protein [Halomonas sp.]|jgi:hypothetical protein|uniref:DUF3549 family protein n=1 Tax=Billgrantia tianxiuensis TaxID=2497861 RepID=A0A6I6SQ59_9GAMM|nr:MULTISPECIES: DUF3549 family protein [Halomonas]MCE8035662.1 DUF3549 family protein [Halomonas sp. MCCC 1A11057]MDX5434762.1 DUF3549 family protein [Halomonas sp.]QHC50736.1 DUF3549 family protein [Halomonas tianxiuensis]
MQPIHTLHDFFDRTGAEVRLYHMGRRVEPCSLRTLADLENDTSPWPLPWQGQARLGIVFRLGDLADPLIWFLALPLDEQGQLVPAPRDAFLQRLLVTLGRNVERVGHHASDSGEIDNLMHDNPLAFTPSLPFQAMLHARATHDTGNPASPHLEPVEAYLSGQQQVDWQFLGLQGLADFAVRLDEEAASLLASTLPTLPDEVLHSLCYCLEHVTIPAALAHALRDRGEQAAAAGHLETLCACVRAVGSAERTIAGPWFDSLLDDPAACGPDLLAAIAARGWEHLEDGQRLPRFLERLAQQSKADFSSAARDLALIPRLRLPVLVTLREARQDSAIGQRLAGLAQ